MSPLERETPFCPKSTALGVGEALGSAVASGGLVPTAVLVGVGVSVCSSAGESVGETSVAREPSFGGGGGPTDAEFSVETTAAAFGATRLTATNALSSPRLNRVNFGLNARRTLASGLWCEVSEEDNVILSPLIDGVDVP